ncbi:MAG: dihydrofolate reductase [Bacteroidales bacterium]|jgi:dihydrofolate reductase|nr:dihydrofolate reductase [Bacteroidales bacterium]
MLSIIVAIAENNAIGKNNQLLWHLSADLQYFKKTTAGHSVVMGLNTYLSLPVKPLPKRRNIIICDDKSLNINEVEMVYSIEEAINLVKNEEEVFVCGGASIYRQMLPLCGKLYITKVLQNFDADTFFPEISKKDWKLTSESDVFEENGLNFQFCVFEKNDGQ